MRSPIKPVRLWTGLACLAILLGAVCIWLKASADPGQRTIRELRDELHVGQGEMEVEIILDHHKIEYCYHPEVRQIQGIVRNVSSGMLISSSVEILINLDAANRVIEVLMSPVLTGP